MKFTELLAKTKKDLFKGKILALDPGETTGWCTLELKASDSPLASRAEVRPHYCAGQIVTNPIEQATPLLTKLFEEQKPDHIVCEDYRVYSWKTKSHSWEELHTPQLIGSIRTLAQQLNIPISFEMAQQPKQFVTDEKLKEWGIYHRGMKHARDAQRHAIYFLLFRQVQKS
jgi:hypothetical protein